MPIWLRDETPDETEESVGLRAVAPADVQPRAARGTCTLEPPYTPRDIPSVSISSDVIAYASPDSTFAVAKELFDGAAESILIGIYDFSAPHMRQVLLDAMTRGVKVSIMLDINSAGEQKLVDELNALGAAAVCAPSCSHPSVHVFSLSHEKVIVIDGMWTLVQSGNYSANSIPFNVADGGGGPGFRTGNRDTGLAIRSTRLAKLFTEILTADIALVTGTRDLLRAEPPSEPLLVERAPRAMPSKLFPSKRFNLTDALTVQPVLSPDNYMSVVPGLLRAATRSILIQQQYIRSKQTNIRKLLTAIAEARNDHPDLEIRIVLGKVFDASDLDDERANLKRLSNDFGLELGTHIRYVNTDQLVHCHNKMVVVDGSGVLISSQNWSDAAVTRNREAGLWVPDEALARYFTDIFDTDWEAAFTTPEQGVTDATVDRGLVAEGGFLPVAPADYDMF